MRFYKKPFISRSNSNIIAWFGILVLSAIAIFFAYSRSEYDGYTKLDNVSANQVDLYVAGLASELEKYEFLPGIIQLDPNVLALLETPNSVEHLDAANKRLSNYNVRAGSVTIFVLNTNGVVRASSNWYQPQSLVGMRYSSLPFFSDAMEGRVARYFATNGPRNSSEYYTAQPIRKNGAILGIAVVKISLEPIESIWIESSARSRNEKLLLVDENGTIIMSSVPEWKFMSTALFSSHSVMPAKQKQLPVNSAEPIDIAIEQGFKYGTHLVKLSYPASNTPSVLYVAREKSMALFGLHIIIFSDASDVSIIARNTAIGAGATSWLLGLLVMYLLQRRRVIASKQRSQAALQRAHDELELRINERTAELQQTNAELVHEIVERKRMEEVLREAQNELVQATKLALLGQMSAGITHEINQPLTALRALSYNTQQLVKRGRTQEISKNLQSIADLTDRMIKITAQLKSFARKTPVKNMPVLLTKAVENTLILMEDRIRSERILLQLDISDSLTVFCDNNKLEQVLLNLFTNALDAMSDASFKTLSIHAGVVDGRALIRITDSGTGISNAVRHHLFEPFFSTKPIGEGLGLGLVISASIVREFGGELCAVNNHDGGATFEFHLNLAEGYIHV